MISHVDGVPGSDYRGVSVSVSVKGTNQGCRAGNWSTIKLDFF